MSTTRTRRRFTAAFKLKILEAAAQCTKPGELAGLAQRRGPKPAIPDPSAKRIVALERQLARATARAERLEIIVSP